MGFSLAHEQTLFLFFPVGMEATHHGVLELLLELLFGSQTHWYSQERPCFILNDLETLLFPPRVFSNILHLVRFVWPLVRELLVLWTSSLSVASAQKSRVSSTSAFMSESRATDRASRCLGAKRL